MAISNYLRMVIVEDLPGAIRLSKDEGLRDSLIVSFSLGAKIFLDKKGIRSYYPNDLIEMPDLNNMGIVNIGLVNRICSHLDTELKKRIYFLNENDIDLISGSYFFIKCFIDGSCGAYSIIDKLLKEFKVKELVVFKGIRNQAGLFNNISPRIATAVAENVFNNCGIALRCIPYDNAEIGNAMLSELRKIYKTIKSLLQKSKNNKMYYTAKAVIMHDSHDVPYVMKYILDDVDFYKLEINSSTAALTSIYSGKSYSNKFCQSVTDLIASINSTFNKITEDIGYSTTFANKDLFLFIITSIKDFVLKISPRILSSAAAIKKAITDLAPCMVLTSTCRLREEDSFALGVVKSLNIPVVTYQEGGGMGYMDWPMYNIDIKKSDYFLTYGEGIGISVSMSQNYKLTPVGSIRLQHIKNKILRKGRPQNKIFIVLALITPNMFQHFPYNGGLFCQAYKHQLNILNTVKHFDNYKFVIKTIRDWRFLYAPFRNKGYLEISTVPLSEILDEAGAFILDWPSTVMLECILTKKPLALLYDSEHVKFNEDAYRSLGKRIRMCTEPSRYAETIESLMQDIKNGTDMVLEDEFLNRYCITNGNRFILRSFFDGIINAGTVSKIARKELLPRGNQTGGT